RHAWFVPAMTLRPPRSALALYHVQICRASVAGLVLPLWGILRRRRHTLRGDIRRRRSVVVEQDAVRRAVHVVELSAVGHAQEDPRGEDHDGEAERDQQVERFHHAFSRAAVPARGASRVAAVAARAAGATRSAGISRSALSTTSIELVDMPIAASHGGTHPAAAAGIAIAL